MDALLTDADLIDRLLDAGAWVRRAYADPRPGAPEPAVAQVLVAVKAAENATADEIANRLSAPAGTVRRALAVLDKAGLTETSATPGGGPADRRRRPRRLTALGERALAEILARARDAHDS